MDTNTITIAYAGTLGFASDLNTEMSFFKKIKSWIWTYNRNARFAKARTAYPLFHLVAGLPAEYRKRVKVHLWGVIDPRNVQLAKSLGISDQILIEGIKTKKETKALLATADLLYLPIEMNPPQHNTLFIPGKLFEYLSMRKPVLCFSEESDAADVLKESGLGIIVNPKALDAAILTLRELIDNWGKTETILPKQDFIESFTYHRKVDELEKIIYNVVAK